MARELSVLLRSSSTRSMFSSDPTDDGELTSCSPFSSCGVTDECDGSFDKYSASWECWSALESVVSKNKRTPTLGLPTLSSTVLIRSAVRPSTALPISLNRISKSCALTASRSICLQESGCVSRFELRGTRGGRQFRSPSPKIPNSLLCPLPPAHRVLALDSQFPTLSTYRRIATAFRFALPARFTGSRHTAVESWRDPSAVSGNGDFGIRRFETGGRRRG